MGEVFAGRFELIDPIASGGMGTVWRVLDHTDGRVKAAKMLRQTDAAMLLRFVREQSMRIDHTHVVTPESWAGVDDRVLFTMPLVRGGSVAGLIKKYGALPPRWIGHLVDQTLQALEAVHAAAIVHRDVKPGNLLLEPTGRGTPHLRLTDFGIAVPADEPRLTQVAMVIGTPGYMPPEQVAGADPAPSADIYALGMVTLEMLTGRRPLADPAAGDAAPPRTGDPRHDLVVDLIAAATSFDPAARPGATELRRHASLRALLALPPDPHDPVEVVDEYGALPPPPSLATQGGTASTTRPPYPPLTSVLPPPPPTHAVPNGTIAQAPTYPAGSSRLPAVALIVAGVLGLLASAWLLLG
ncbi:serine/threonine-protein kinase [Nocardioides thalensis]|uniref:non-specific serine/threonine protein kinase n=1 Tax=Nocardioides thalensis TaxID=1914755 RepID=A0A853C8X9_9ACTN|nr:serine/threonine-protein kinase [Nocardioides thalensis]NYJ03476.1 serine/threonine-protein kinase [Nocardioides thalensis]